MKHWTAVLSIVPMLAVARGAPAQGPAVLRNQRGLRLLAVTDAAQPTVRIVLPGHEVTDRSIEVLVPEHVTAAQFAAVTQPKTGLFGPRQGMADEPELRGHAPFDAIDLNERVRNARL